MPPRRKAASAANRSLKKLARPTKAKKRAQQKRAKKQRCTNAKKSIKKAPVQNPAAVPPVPFTAPPILPSSFTSTSFTDLHRSSYRGEERSPQFAWQDLVGIDEIKDNILDSVILPFALPGKVAILNMKPPRGLLLTGEPGTGKTALADGIVREIRRQRGQVKYFQETGSCLSSYIGETENKLRTLFKTAHDEGPSIIFLDELDGLTRKRSSSAHSDAFSSIITTLLNLINNVERGKVLLIAATNCPDLVDPAMIRKGRFDKTVCIPLPDLAARHAILEHYLEKLDHHLEDEELALVAEALELCTGSDIEALSSAIHLKTVARVFPNRSWVNMPPSRLQKLKPKMQELDMRLDVIPALEENINNFDIGAFTIKLENLED